MRLIQNLTISWVTKQTFMIKTLGKGQGNYKKNDLAKPIKTILDPFIEP
jgi:hypothetical protein